MVAPLARLSPALDQVLTRGDTLDDDLELVHTFRPSLLVAQAPSLSLAWAARRAGVPLSIGPGDRAFSRLYSRRVPARAGRGLHQVEAALAYAHLAGARPGPAVFPLSIPDEIEDGLAHRRAAHASPSATGCTPGTEAPRRLAAQAPPAPGGAARGGRGCRSCSIGPADRTGGGARSRRARYGACRA